VGTLGVAMKEAHPNGENPVEAAVSDVTVLQGPNDEAGFAGLDVLGGAASGSLDRLW